jgi:TPR repeat protein
MAAEAGLAKAQVQLGQIYLQGVDEVPHDYAQAMKWFRKAAEKGDPDGEFSLGNMYQQGLGVPENLPEAIAWYQRASKDGQVQAPIALRTLGVAPGK